MKDNIIRENNEYDVIVVGAGHAGCEAGLAAARLGCRTLVLTISLESVAHMPCNPSIGGTGKGQLVKEIDALGGEMGIVIDKTFIQSKMLNRTKGPAVHSPRAQADKQRYHEVMKLTLERQENLDLVQGEVVKILFGETENNGQHADGLPEALGGDAETMSVKQIACQTKNPMRPFAGIHESENAVKQITCQTKMPDGFFAEGDTEKNVYTDFSPAKIACGVRTKSGADYKARAVILATGTYLNSLVHVGDRAWHSGPSGMTPSLELAASLLESGIELRRFKTGTPARVLASSLDYTELQEQKGDEEISPFSFMNDTVGGNKISCWLTRTNPKAHKIVADNIEKTAPYGGHTTGVGPRYCLSIEDKVSRFPERERHQIFLEPEGLSTEEVYVQGMSTSLPEELQTEFYRSIAGLGAAKISRFAYSIEYDCIDPTRLKKSLEYRDIGGLFFAGQINGSSGYEEAAAQGLVAGVNAARHIFDKMSWTPDRSEAYIGVLIDDLVTKGTDEPYRIMTSRAEFRLVLRQDNADLRLTAKGFELGLASRERYAKYLKNKDDTEREVRRLREIFIERSLADDFVNKVNGKQKDADLSKSASDGERASDSLATVIIGNASKKESEGGRADNSTLPASSSGGCVSYADLLKRPEITWRALSDAFGPWSDVPLYARTQAEIQIKYEGYITKQEKQIERFRKLEHRLIPERIDYFSLNGLRNEAKEKLAAFRPASVGEAGRISGVSPADIGVLLVHLERISRETP